MFFKRRYVNLVLPLAVLLMLSSWVRAQEAKRAKEEATAKPAEETPLQRVWKELQNVEKESNGDPQKEIALLAEYVAHHPSEIKGRDVTANFGFIVARLLPKMKGEPATLVSSLEPMDKAMSAVSPFDRSTYDSILASQGPLKLKILLDYGAHLAKQSVDILTESDYIAAAQAEHQQSEEYHRKRDKDFKPEPFDMSDAHEHFLSEKAGRLATLGSIEAALCKRQEAADAFTQALTFHSNTNAYLGLSLIEEGRGEKAKALDLLAKAYLAGRLPAENIAHLHSLYGEVHPTAEAKQLQEFLDEMYRPTFHNPISPEPYKPEAHRTARKVLAELFTGAGCEPCVAPDLAFDAALMRYTRNDLVLVVYHNNAPDLDPLTNFGGDERAGYYETGGSTPHVIIDGKEYKMEEGLASHAAADYDKLTPIVEEELNRKTGAELNVTAKRDGQKVYVSVRGHVPDLKTGAHLQIELVEKEVHYSGGNTLRFQPMVERGIAMLKEPPLGVPAKSIAGEYESGLQIPAGGVVEADYVFDLDQLAGASLRYNDQELAWLHSRVPMFQSYRETRPEIDPTNLAVVVFVQDDQTKDVLQSRYFEVPNPVKKEKSD